MPTLIQNPDKFFWLINEVYIGPGSALTQVNAVKQGDLVLDWGQGILKVDSVDVNFIPTMSIWNPVENVTLGEENNGLLMGLSQYQPSVINRAFHWTDLSNDNWVQFDSRFRIFGADSAYCKIFRGTDTSGTTGVIISINQTPPPVDTISLVEVTVGEPGIKVPPSMIKIGPVLVNGDLITLVSYTATGIIISETTFVVKLSTAVAPLTNTNKVVTSINIDPSSLMDPAWLINPDTLEIPANIGLQLNNLDAIVNYSDSSNQVISIDGTQCKLLGMENFNNNLAGIIGYLTLVYNPSNDEFISSGNWNGQVTHTYQVITTNDNMDTRFKVYVSIFYNELTNLYGFRFYLTHVDYREPILLTSTQYTVQDENGNAINLNRTYQLGQPAFNLVIKVKMEEVFPGFFDNYIFTQQMTIDLTDVTSYSSTWLIDYEMDNVNKLNGIYKFITDFNSSFESLNMIAGATSQGEWLDRLYEPIAPIFVLPDTQMPTPTHFRVRYIHESTDYTSTDIPLGQWNQLLTPTTFPWIDKSTVEIFWLRDNPGNPRDVIGITPVLVIATYV